MIFTKIPNNFQSFQDPILIAFDMEEVQEKVDVVILKRDGTQIGHKRLYGVKESQIDIAPYVRRAAEVTIPERVVTADFFDTGASIDVMVEIAGTRTGIFTFTAARTDESNDFLLLTKQISHRVMAYDDFDTIGFVNKTGAPVSAQIVAKEGTDIEDRFVIESTDKGQFTIAITPQDFRRSVKSISVTIYYDDVAQECIEYEIRENMAGAQRVVWLNEDLAPECYTFPLRKSILIEATRKRMETLWGREAAAVEGDGELKLISAYEPQAQLMALGKIISSPKVWVQQESNSAMADMRTERAMISPGNGMGFIEIDLRAAKEGAELW